MYNGEWIRAFYRQIVQFPQSMKSLQGSSWIVILHRLSDHFWCDFIEDFQIPEEGLACLNVRVMRSY